ncbi:MAG: nicotinate-nucleotide--dimethylbenzimidazole phosphoribosyltransferase [Spirochaetia bacterium]|nr:nicotinate-nucleotide--dimethylbenzimidazole phosphoribosyltransferase [Spirochaetia bacterium]
MLSFQIRPVDRSIEAALQQKIDTKTKPLGALGMLEDLALKIGLIQNSLNPVLNNPAILVFAADHGITDERVSAFPKVVTSQMVLNFLAGGAAINAFCKQNNILLRIIDAGVDADFNSTAIISRKIGRGTRNFMREPAMTQAQLDAAIEAGAILAKDESVRSNVIGFGEMGIGNTSAAAVLTHRYTGVPLDDLVGRGTGVSEEGLNHKRQVLNIAAKLHASAQEPMDVMRCLGGFEIAMMLGGMLQAAQQRMIILIDGFIATAAFLCAYRLNPNILDYAVFAHCSAEAGHLAALNFLNVKPLLQLGMRLGEGSGAAVAYPILVSAVAFLNEMASFTSASVSGKSS